MLYLSQSDTEKLDIRMTEVVPAMEEAFRRVGNGQAVVAPQVRVLHLPLQKNSMGEGRPWVRDLRIIPGAIEDVGYGVRLGASLRRQGGGVLLVLFDWDTMELKALISDHLVHAVRSGAQHRALRRDGEISRSGGGFDAGVDRLWPAGPLGRRSGVRGAADPRFARVESDPGLSRQTRLGSSVMVREFSSSEEAIRGAQIVTTGTKALTPVMRGEWISPGCTILANSPEEIDQATYLKGKIITTYNDGILTHVPPYRDLVALVQSGKMSEADFSTELADIVTGNAKGRSHAEEIWIGMNPAYGIHDVATASWVYERAKKLGVGRSWRREGMSNAKMDSGTMRLSPSYETPTFGNPASFLVPLISSNTISSTD